MTEHLTPLERLLILEEGYRQHAYDDATGKPVKAPVGNITLGIGRNLNSDGLDKEEALWLLRRDIEKRRVKLFDHIIDDDEMRFDIWIAMAFQMGVPGVLAWHESLALFAQGNYAAVAQHMLASKWARQTPERAERMAQMMESGEYLPQYLEPLAGWEV